MIWKTISIAAHSTWNYVRDFNFLIDAGDGVSTHLGIGPAQSLKIILLTHDHWDHVAGLYQLLALRERGVAPVPLPICVPRIYLNYKKLRGVRAAFGELADFRGFDPNEQRPIELSGKLFASPFPVKHYEGAAGYKIFEKRSRLKAQFAGFSPEMLAELARKIKRAGAKPEFSEPYDKHLITYTGDTAPLSHELLGNPDWLIHEATYPVEEMNCADRFHSTFKDAQEAQRAINARLIINHLSLRWMEASTENSAVKWIEDISPEIKYVSPRAKECVFHL